MENFIPEDQFLIFINRLSNDGLRLWMKEINRTGKNGTRPGPNLRRLTGACKALVIIGKLQTDEKIL